MSEFTVHDDARRSRILEAALIEFAAKGYKKASTNTIVREANVSKGLLFHYFISKKDLYVYIVESALESITNELYAGINFADRDVLERVHTAAIIKIESYVKHPLFSQLFETVVDVEDEEITARINQKQKQVADESYAKLFTNIDYFLFRDRLNVERCLDVIRWTVDKLGNDWKKDHKDPTKPESFHDLQMFLEQYLGLFKAAFYR
jgi:TetR/AcrR family transcriptional regulator